MSGRRRQPLWGRSYVRADRGGATIHSQIKNVGYGFTEYQIVGTFDEVSAATESILRSYPDNPYGTWFNWPPGTKRGHEGRLIEHREATDLGGGLWHVTGSHSNTSD